MNIDQHYRELTLDEIAMKEGFTEPFIVDEEVPLSKWFGRIQNIRLKDLSDGDLAKLLRQDFHLKYTVSEALNRLIQNPFAGDLYDGEILVSMNEIEESFWMENKKLAFCTREIILRIKEGQIKVVEEELCEIFAILDQLERKLTIL